MADKVFVDTNILFYAHSKQSDEKKVIANQIIKELWANDAGVLSLQVLQEFYVCLIQKVSPPISIKQAREIISFYKNWDVVCFQVEDLFQAMDLQARYQFSFWDSLIVQAAMVGGCSILLTEDLQHNFKLKDLQIKNPFLI